MKYETVRELEDEKFRRLTGVKKTTFKRMTEILDIDERKQSKSKLYIEDRLLMALEYMREHIFI